MKKTKSFISFALSFILAISTLFVCSFNVSADDGAEKTTTILPKDIWTGDTTAEATQPINSSLIKYPENAVINLHLSPSNLPYYYMEGAKYVFEAENGYELNKLVVNTTNQRTGLTAYGATAYTGSIDTADYMPLTVTQTKSGIFPSYSTYGSARDFEWEITNIPAGVTCVMLVATDIKGYDNAYTRFVVSEVKYGRKNVTTLFSEKENENLKTLYESGIRYFRHDNIDFYKKDGNLNGSNDTNRNSCEIGNPTSTWGTGCYPQATASNIVFKPDSGFSLKQIAIRETSYGNAAATKLATKDVYYATETPASFVAGSVGWTLLDAAGTLTNSTEANEYCGDKPVYLWTISGIPANAKYVMFSYTNVSTSWPSFTKFNIKQIKSVYATEGASPISLVTFNETNKKATLTLNPQFAYSSMTAPTLLVAQKNNNSLESAQAYSIDKTNLTTIEVDYDTSKTNEFYLWDMNDLTPKFVKFDIK